MVRGVAYALSAAQASGVFCAILLIWNATRPVQGANMLLMALPHCALLGVLPAGAQICVLAAYRDRLKRTQYAAFSAQAWLTLILSLPVFALG